MPRRRREPTWLTRAIVLAIHDAQLREHGGTPGVRDEGMLESALARPQNKFAYSSRLDFAALSAAYAFGIAKGHPFVDGNKRTAFVAAALFLRQNGYSFIAAEPEVVRTLQRLASGHVSEPKLSEWIRAGMRPLDWK